MNRFAKFDVSPRLNTNPVAVRSLLSLLPASQDPFQWLHFQFADDDPRLVQAIAIFHAHGVPRMDESSPTLARIAEHSQVGYYIIRHLHEFSSDDLSTAEYLCVSGLDSDRDAGGIGRTENRELILWDHHLPEAFGILGNFENILVRQEYRADIEGEGFIGLALRPTHRSNETRNRDKAGNIITKPLLPIPHGEEIWEIWPSIELPPMYGPEIVRQTWEGIGPCTPQGPGGFLNPGFDDGQAVYTRTALRGIGSFDLARTWEYMYPQQPDVRWIIISQRFYRFLIDRGVEGTFIPVKIVDA